MIGPMRWPWSILLAVLLSGCIGIGGCRISFPPLRVEQVGPLLTDPDGGPPVECRGLAVDRCDIGFTILDDRRGDTLDPADVSRIVVSCVGTCTAEGGETRMDVVLADGGTQLMANGGYGEFEQSCA